MFQHGDISRKRKAKFCDRIDFQLIRCARICMSKNTCKSCDIFGDKHVRRQRSFTP